MNAYTALQLRTNFRLRFRPLNPNVSPYAVPCDAAGHVDLDALTDEARNDYFFARAVIGRQFALPAIELNG